MGFLWSMAAISVVLLLGELLRVILRKLIPQGYLPYIEELVSAFELSACVFEISVIGKFYNGWIALLCSFCLLTLKNAEYLFADTFANPCGLLEGLVEKKAPWVGDGVVKILFQVVGALLSFPFIQAVWNSTWSDLHFQQVKKGLRSTLEVSLLLGFSIEILATFLTAMSDYLSRGELLKKFNPVIRSTVCVVVCYYLAETTGTWMNPALATAQTFVFCSRKEVIGEHLFVFWVGPLIGTLAAIGINVKLLKPDTTKENRKKGMVKKIKLSAEKNLLKNGAVKHSKRRHVRNA